MTDLSPPEAPQPGESQPDNGASPTQRGSLPQRQPVGESRPQRNGSVGGPPHSVGQADATTPSGDVLARLRDALLDSDDTLPGGGNTVAQGGVGQSLGGWQHPHGGEPLPQRAAPQGESAAPLPQRGAQFDPSPSASLPRRGAQPDATPSLPQRGAQPEATPSLPQRGAPLPEATPSLPQRGAPLPQRGGAAGGPEALPRRTTRTRPSGRHRSPHRLSVASDAPALVLAVPGTAEADTDEIGPRVAAIAELSCPGVDIRVGYVEGADLSLADCLVPDTDSADHDQFPSVIVPLLLGPSPAIDAVLADVAAQLPVPAVVADHLGPHPLVAEGLHARLAEAGLARHARATGLSISADRRGIIVLADRDEQAASAAAIAAVLLASRLSVPVVPASLGDPASIADAATRLSDSGVRPALAPCLIGPETSLPVLEDLSAALGAPAAATLGAHQTVGQLVAIRYGAALASLTLAG